jgi:hypothetical protein
MTAFAARASVPDLAACAARGSAWAGGGDVCVGGGGKERREGGGEVTGSAGGRG